MSPPPLRVAFVVPVFPRVSETFIVDQIADLVDRGVAVRVFAFNRGSAESVSQRYFQYGMSEMTSYLAVQGRFRRAMRALIALLRLFWFRPLAALRVLRASGGKRDELFRLVFLTAPFAGRDFDLVHAHFGEAAIDFLAIDDLLKLRKRLVTTFYGADISQTLRQRGHDVYDRLKRDSALCFVMSNDMKKRVVALGFDAGKVIVHPVGVRPNEYPFRLRGKPRGDVRMLSVSRLVEKKGVDDLLRAAALVKERIGTTFRCIVVGDGHLRGDLQALAERLKVTDVVEFRGFMPIQEVIALFSQVDFLVQPSKTAASGDME